MPSVLAHTISVLVCYTCAEQDCGQLGLRTLSHGHDEFIWLEVKLAVQLQVPDLLHQVRERLIRLSELTD